MEWVVRKMNWRGVPNLVKAVVCKTTTLRVNAEGSNPSSATNFRNEKWIGIHGSKKKEVCHIILKYILKGE